MKISPRPTTLRPQAIKMDPKFHPSKGELKNDGLGPSPWTKKNYTDYEATLKQHYDYVHNKPSHKEPAALVSKELLKLPTKYDGVNKKKKRVGSVRRRVRPTHSPHVGKLPLNPTLHPAYRDRSTIRENTNVKKDMLDPTVPDLSGPGGRPKLGGPYTQVLPDQVIDKTNDKRGPTSLQAMLADHKITTNVLKTRPRPQNVAYVQMPSSYPGTKAKQTQVHTHTIKKKVLPVTRLCCNLYREINSFEKYFPTGVRSGPASKSSQPRHNDAVSFSGYLFEQEHV